MQIKNGSKAFVAIVSLLGLAIILFLSKRKMAGFDPSCPSGIQQCNGENQLYHLRSKRCLKIGESNGDMCGKNMVVSPLFTCRIEGECECDYENTERHLVYHEATEQCYPVYSQGPCDDGYIVFISANLKKFKCKRDACLGEKSKAPRADRDSIVQFKNKCYNLSAELDEPECRGKLKFWKNQLHPSCGPPPTHEHLISGHVPLRCQPGSWQASDGHCQPSGGFQLLRWHRFIATVDYSEDDLDDYESNQNNLETL